METMGVMETTLSYGDSRVVMETSYRTFLEDLLHSSEVVLLSFGVGDRSIRLTGEDASMSQQVSHGDDAHILIEELFGKGVSEAMAMDGQSGLLGIALHQLLHSFDGERLCWTLLIPKEIVFLHRRGTLVQTGSKECFDFLTEGDDAIFVSLGLVDKQRVGIEVDVLESERYDFADSEATSKHQGKEGTISGLGDGVEEDPDFLVGERMRESSSLSEEVRSSHRTAQSRIYPFFDEAIEVLECVESSVDGGRIHSLGVLCFDEGIHVVDRDVLVGFEDDLEEAIQISLIAVERMGGIVSSFEISDEGKE